MIDFFFKMCMIEVKQILILGLSEKHFLLVISSFFTRYR